MDAQICFNEASIHRAHRGWVIRIPTLDGRVLEYPYRSARAARYFLEVFRMAPTWYPAPNRIRHLRAAAAEVDAVLQTGPARPEPVPDPELAQQVDAAFDALGSSDAPTTPRLGAEPQSVSPAEFDAAWAAAFPGTPQLAADDSATGFHANPTGQIRSA